MIEIKLTTFLLKPVPGSGRMLLGLWSENRHSGKQSSKKSLDFTTVSVVIQPHNDQFCVGNADAIRVRQQIRGLASQV